MSFRCAICDGTSAEKILEARDYPIYLVPIPAELAPAVPRAALPIYACTTCGHIQQHAPDPELQRQIYEVYYTHYVVDAAEALVPAYRVPFESFLAGAGLPRGDLLEIGCSTGERAPYFAGFANSYTGIDPSQRLPLARARHPQHRFIQGYFPDALDGGEFDVVVSQFNLEHILDLGKFIAAVHRHLRPGGVFVFQVPDIAAFERNVQPNFLAHEHVQYFRREPLERLLRRHGLEPMAWGPEGPSLIGAARRAAGPIAELPAAADPLAAARAHARLFEQRPALPPGPLVLYGVGPLLYWLLEGAARADEIAVVDDNPTYLGQGLPGTTIRIEAPTVGLLRRIPTVVLSLNPIYHERVAAKLRQLGVPLAVHAVFGGELRS